MALLAASINLWMYLLFRDVIVANKLKLKLTGREKKKISNRLVQ